jgi:predicted RNA methylase
MARKTSDRNVDNDILEILARMQVDGQILRPVSETLDRGVYKRLNEVLEGMGGKWKRGAGHIFADVPDLADRVEAVLLTGNYHCQKSADKLLGFFRTPTGLAEQLAEEIVAAVGSEGPFLEPSAGDGRMAQAFLSAGVPRSAIACVEEATLRVDQLRKQGFRTLETDFLTMTTHEMGCFRGILMNPPFTRGADIKHVRHALTMRDGRFCFRAIMSAGILWKEDDAAKRLRAVIKDLGGTITELPPGTFSSEGTEVQTCVVRIG